jgi:hypothetical protein
MFTLPMMPEAALPQNESSSDGTPVQKKSEHSANVPAEIGGRGGLDPTRYGDWEKNGRCIDF